MKVDPEKSMLAGIPGVAEAFRVDADGCGCWSCLSQITQENGMPVTWSVMIVCDVCGNKRCPRATHHALACTDSNEPGQLGSRYGGLDDPMSKGEQREQ